MAETPRIGVSDLLWWVFYLALALAALFAKAELRGLIALTGAVLVAWCVEVFRARGQGYQRPATPERRFLTLVFGTFFILELIAASTVFVAGAAGIGVLFASLVVFSVLGIATLPRREPADLALVAVLGFHGLMSLSTFVTLVWLVTGRPGGPSRGLPLGVPESIVNVTFGISVMFAPLVCICTLMAIFVEHVTGRARVTRVWQVQLVGQLAWILLCARVVAALTD